MSASALQCLTEAIIHEAGYEPIAGREAVAQVILNRVAHPAYPNTVCGVVYQGSARRTGCQFSFTCDGSLGRAVRPSVRAQAAEVARRALDGEIPDRVGAATHYHANYVQPYWAPTLTRVTTIGAHIFYRIPGVRLASGAGRGSIRNSGDPTGAPPSAPQPTVFSPWGLVALEVRSGTGVAVASPPTPRP